MPLVFLGKLVKSWGQKTPRLKSYRKKLHRGGHYGPPYVIFVDNFLTEVFFDPNSSQVFLKTPKTHFKRNLESKIFFTGRVIRVFLLRGLNYEILFLDFFQLFN